MQCHGIQIHFQNLQKHECVFCLIWQYVTDYRGELLNYLRYGGRY